MEDRLKLGEERRLIFENVAKGVPMQQVMASFRRSEAEVMREVAFVGRKIREYRFRRRLPPLACETIKDMRWNRKALLECVAKLGPEYLSSELMIPRITVQSLDHPSVVREAGHRAGVSLRGL